MVVVLRVILSSHGIESVRNHLKLLIFGMIIPRMKLDTSISTKQPLHLSWECKGPNPTNATFTRFLNRFLRAGYVLKRKNSRGHAP